MRTLGTVVGASLVGAALFGGAGCRQRDPNVGMEGNDVVTFSDRLDKDAPQLVDFWEDRVQKAGCTNIQRRSADVVVAKCGGVPIVLVKSGLDVTVGCKSITLPECKQLFRDVANAGKASGGASSDDVVIVMTKQIPSVSAGGQLIGRWAKAAELAGCKPTVTKPDIAIYDCTEGRAGALLKTANGAIWFGLGCFSMSKGACEQLHKRILEEAAEKKPDESTTF
ncbi:MAG: hypothetical protein JST00_44005 [Deltaproteobacteria bacterium]|nr:hypothetical protein [Deltaproteobacteria bacterium]